MSLKPIVHDSLRDRVAATLRESILNGTLSAGERLTEPELARRLNTSRGPVREALRDLEQEGLVKSSAHRSVQVMELAADEVEEVLLPIRLTIEDFAFRRATDLMTDEDFQMLEEIVSNMEVAAREGVTQRLVDLDVAFHDVVVRIGAQDQGITIWRSIQPRLQATFMREHQSRYGPQARVGIAAEHRILVEALRDGDPDAIASRLREHVERYREQPPAPPSDSDALNPAPALS